MVDMFGAIQNTLQEYIAVWKYFVLVCSNIKVDRIFKSSVNFMAKERSQNGIQHENDEDWTKFRCELQQFYNLQKKIALTLQCCIISIYYVFVDI